MEPLLLVCDGVPVSCGFVPHRFLRSEVRRCLPRLARGAALYGIWECSVCGATRIYGATEPNKINPATSPVTRGAAVPSGPPTDPKPE